MIIASENEVPQLFINGKTFNIKQSNLVIWKKTFLGRKKSNIRV